MTLAWVCAGVGFGFGAALSVVPGFPGCVVALAGVFGFAWLTDFTVLPPSGLWLAAGLTALGAVGQLVGPVLGTKALGGSIRSVGGVVRGVIGLTTLAGCTSTFIDVTTTMALAALLGVSAYAAG